MDAKKRLDELEEQIKLYLTHIVLEKEIADDQSLIDDMISRINGALQEIKGLRVIVD
jgi:hypothetical protein